MLTLGLDVSTSKTGWCILDSSGELVKMGCVDLRDLEDLFQKSDFLMSEIRTALASFSNEEIEIVIEEPLLSFSRGASSASTLLTLNRFNGMVTHACWKSLGTKPVHLNVIFARRALGIKRDKTRHVKEVVFEWASYSLPGYLWPTKQVTRGKNKGLTVMEDVCYDMADAYVMAKAHCASRV
jgi:hypothetical protein